MGKKSKSRSRTRLNETAPSLRAKTEFDYLHQVALWGLLALLFLPPYFRGLFFAQEQQAALVFAALVFVLVLLQRWLHNDHKFLRGPLDYFALALPLIYLISAFTAVNKGLAINEVVKNTLYFLVFWSASRLIRNSEDLHRILQVIYFSAIGVALAGLTTATGIININDGFLDGRIYSTFQYPNALASYLAAVFLIGMYFWLRTGDYAAALPATGFSPAGLFSPANVKSYLYAWGNFILLAVLIGTKSRGGLLVFGMVFLIYLMALGAKNRLLTAIQTAFSGLVALFCITRFISLAAGEQHAQAWLWIFIGLALVLAGQLLIKMIEARVFAPWGAEPRKYNLTFGALAGIGAAAGGVLACSRTAIWEKIASFEFLRNALERMYFVNDALEMIKERPLLGWGGGGWKEAYRSFQEYLYNSNEVHSYYLQLGVEAGLLGLLAVAGLWFSFLYCVYRIFKEKPAVFPTAWVLTAAFLVIAGHAAIDFDLSLSALALVLWAIFGMVNSLYNQMRIVPKGPRPKTGLQELPKAPLALGIIASITIITLTMFLIQANSYAKEGSRYLQARQIDKGLAYIERAASYNPFLSDYRELLAQIYGAKAEDDKSMQQARRAVELSLYSSQRRMVLADSCIAAGKYDQGLEQAEKALALSPFQIQWYEALADRYLLVGQRLLEEGRQEEARTYLEKAMDLPDRINDRMDSVPGQYLKMWSVAPLLSPSESIMLAAGSAQYHLGLYSEAGESLTMPANSGNDAIRGSALVYLAAAWNKNGQPGRADELLTQAESFWPEARANYEKLLQLPAA